MYELKDFGERMKLMAVMEPFFQLRSNQNRNDKYRQYDMVAVGFALLLHLAENSILAQEPYTFENIAEFFQALIKKSYDQELALGDLEDMTYYFLDIMQNEGRRFKVTYQDFELAKPQVYSFNLIEAKSNEMYNDIRYYITNEGIDFLFKTREVVEELQLTMTQLFFRQQMNRGVFSGALKSIRDMEMQIYNRNEEWERERQRILRNIKQFDKEAYDQNVERMYEQFNKEAELFKMLQNLLETKVEEYRGSLSQKDQEGLNTLLTIKSSLNRVINKHNLLLSFKIDVDTWLMKAMSESVVNSFQTKVDFGQDFIRPILDGKFSLEDAGSILRPMFPRKIHKSFNWMRVFEPQSLPKQGQDEEGNDIPIPTEEELNEAAEREKAIQHEMDKKYLEYIRLFLAPLFKGITHYCLKDILDALSPQQYVRLIGDVDFYSFMVRMHQLLFIPLAIDIEAKKAAVSQEEDNLHYLLIHYVEQHPELAYLERACVVSSPELLELPNGCTITNFTVMVKQKEEKAKHVHAV